MKITRTKEDVMAVDFDVAESRIAYFALAQDLEDAIQSEKVMLIITPARRRLLTGLLRDYRAAMARRWEGKAQEAGGT
jgi:hypothetical protein